MLNPNDRILLLSSLKPPEGYILDFALGTSFTLDLFSLLTVPMGFAFSDWHGANEDDTPNSIALLGALRRSAERIAVFCQIGRISVPKNVDLLYSYLENTVYEVAPDDQQGIFHPKIWIIRFVSEKDKSIRYRVLCSSRNLSPDRSWDTLLCLDGTVADRNLGISVNHPLADFVSELPKLSSRPLSDNHKKSITRIQNELRITKFELPEGFESYAFWPLGIARYEKWPFDTRIDRLLIMAPFVDEGFLTKIGNSGKGNILISRLETLMALAPGSFRNFNKVYFFNPEAKPEEDTTDRLQYSAELPLDGLHAKLFIIEQGWDSYILTGSANATSAALRHNVELLAEMGGKKSQFGIDALLNRSDKKGVVEFIDFLQEFRQGAPMSVDPEKQAIEKLLNDVRDTLVSAGINARVTSAEGENVFCVQLSAKRRIIELSPKVNIKCWPISLHEKNALTANFESGIIANFTPLSFEALTSFFAFELAYRDKANSRVVRFVLNLPLDGAPADRIDRLLYSFLGERNRFLRFLFFLLIDENPEYRGMAVKLLGGNKENDAQVDGPFLSIAIFEMLVRALYRDPEKLDHVNKLVQDLRKTVQGRKLLPDEFDSIWEPIWQARQEIENER